MQSKPSAATHPQPKASEAAKKETQAIDQAFALLKDGLLDQAAQALHQCAAEAQALGQFATAVRLLQLASATNRSAAQPEMARAQAEQALELVQVMPAPEPSLQVLAWCEAAETAQAMGMLDQAAHEFTQASQVADIAEGLRVVVLRRQATVLLGLQRYDQARQALEQVLLVGDLSPSQAARVRVDLAAIAQQAAMSDQKALISRAQSALAGLSADQDQEYAGLHADVLLLLAWQHQQADHTQAALQSAQEAMQISLEAEAANSYAAAALSTWKLLTEQGAPIDQQRLLLLQSQQTLAQLTNQHLAQITFAPALQVCQDAPVADGESK